MLYEFKCRATGAVLMTQPVAERLLAIIGKTPGPQGIVLPDQIPAAIAALETAIAEERARASAHEAEERARASTHEADDRQADRRGGSDDTTDDEASRQAAVTLAQRAWPMLEMLRAAHAAKREITWGV